MKQSYREMRKRRWRRELSRCPRGHEFDYPAYDLSYQTYGPSGMPGGGRLTPVCPVCGEQLYGREGRR